MNFKGMTNNVWRCLTTNEKALNQQLPVEGFS